MGDIVEQLNAEIVRTVDLDMIHHTAANEITTLRQQLAERDAQIELYRAEMAAASADGYTDAQDLYTSHRHTLDTLAEREKELTHSRRVHKEDFDKLCGYVEAYPKLEKELAEIRICRSRHAKRPILYTDSVGGDPSRRDDLWAVSTEELNEMQRDRDALAIQLKQIIELAKKRKSDTYSCGLFADALLALATTDHEAIIRQHDALVWEQCAQFVEDKYDFCGNEILVAEELRAEAEKLRPQVT